MNRGGRFVGSDKCVKISRIMREIHASAEKLFARDDECRVAQPAGRDLPCAPTFEQTRPAVRD
jgi:hypothetical protein